MKLRHLLAECGRGSCSIIVGATGRAVYYAFCGLGLAHRDGWYDARYRCLDAMC